MTDRPSEGTESARRIIGDGPTEAELIAADLAANEAKRSGQLLRDEIWRAQQEELKWNPQ